MNLRLKLVPPSDMGTEAEKKEDLLNYLLCLKEM